MKTEIKVNRAPREDRYPYLDNGCGYQPVWNVSRRDFIEVSHNCLKVYSGSFASSSDLTPPAHIKAAAESMGRFKIYFNSNEQMSQWLIGGMDMDAIWKPEKEYVKVEDVSIGQFLELIGDQADGATVACCDSYGLLRRLDGEIIRSDSLVRWWPLKDGDWITINLRSNDAPAEEGVEV